MVTHPNTDLIKRSLTFITSHYIFPRFSCIYVSPAPAIGYTPPTYKLNHAFKWNIPQREFKKRFKSPHSQTNIQGLFINGKLQDQKPIHSKRRQA